MTDAKRGAEEVARKVVHDLFGTVLSFEPKAITLRVAEALTQYADAQIVEARKEWLKEQKCKDCGCTYEACCCSPVRELKARNEGLEAAALCAEWSNGADYEAIANAIRALKSGGKAT